jgi:hypothetical protein
MIRNLFMAFIGLSLLTSCENLLTATVEIDPPEYTPQLVMHVRLDETATEVRVVLTRTFGSLETVSNWRDYFVDGATLEFFADGQKVGNMVPVGTDSAWVYSIALAGPLQVGKTYEIKGTHPNFQPISTKQVMPAAPEANRFTLNRNALSSDGFNVYNLGFFIKDTPNEVNFYEVSGSQLVFQVQPILDPNGAIIGFDTLFSTIYNLSFDNLNDRNLVQGVGNSVLISDQLFDGQEYPFSANFYPTFFSSTDSNKFDIVVRQVTPEYYRWSKSYVEQANNEFNIFAEPVNVFTNIENGLGIFGLVNGRTYQVQ